MAEAGRAAVMPDHEAVRAFLGRWPAAEAASDRLEVSYVQVDEAGPSRILWEAAAEGGPAVRLAARRIRREKAERLAADINGRHGDGARYSAELGLLFHLFPADPRLPTLPSALDGPSMAPVLEGLLAGRAGARVLGVSASVVRYKPEQKCLVRYDVTWSAEVPATLRTVYGRVSRVESFGATSDTLRRLRSAAKGLLFDLPEPLGVVPGLSLELCSTVPGVALFSLVASEAFPELCRRTGTGLRELHALPVAVERTWSHEDAAARLAAAGRSMAGLFPEQEQRIDRLRGRIERRLASVPAVRPRLIHHDFHGDNVLVHGARLALLDFEDCAMGDPADDVGSSWAQLTWHVSRAQPGTRTADAGRAAFTSAYIERSSTLERDSLTVHAALHTFLFASQCLRHPRDPARFADADTLLAACQDVLDQGLP